jgi:hypothetical protein
MLRSAALVVVRLAALLVILRSAATKDLGF